MSLSSLASAFSGMFHDVFEIGMESRMADHVLSGGSSMDSEYKESKYHESEYHDGSHKSEY